MEFLAGGIIGLIILVLIFEWLMTMIMYISFFGAIAFLFDGNTIYSLISLGIFLFTALGLRSYEYNKSSTYKRTTIKNERNATIILFGHFIILIFILALIFLFSTGLDLIT